jgi:hypothetical protein
MYATINTLPHQTLLDIALQEYGTPEAVFALAMANGRKITDDLPAGSTLRLPTDAPMNAEILNYYKQHGIKPATANINDSLADLITDGEVPEEITPFFGDDFDNEFFNL